jgi:hypothetical protein
MDLTLCACKPYIEEAPLLLKSLGTQNGIWPARCEGKKPIIYAYEEYVIPLQTLGRMQS